MHVRGSSGKTLGARFQVVKVNRRESDSLTNAARGEEAEDAADDGNPSELGSERVRGHRRLWTRRCRSGCVEAHGARRVVKSVGPGTLLYMPAK